MIRLAAIVAALCVVDSAAASMVFAADVETLGMMVYVPRYALPATLLTAVVLRPFLRLASVPNGDVTKVAARASVAGLVAGSFVVLLASEESPLLFLTPFAAYWAIRSVAERHAQDLKRSWVLAGYLAAAILMRVTTVVVFGIRSQHRWLVLLARKYAEEVEIAAACGALAVLIATAFWPFGEASEAASSDAHDDPSLTGGPPSPTVL